MADTDILKNNKDKNIKSDHITDKNIKIIWKQPTDMFFILFSALLEEGFISTRKKGIDEYQTAMVLYNAFDVFPKAHNKKKYTFNTFYQYLKSSANYPAEIKQNKIIKSKIVKLLRTLQSNELSLFS